MPRDFDSVEPKENSEKPHVQVPDLTYDDRKKHAVECDYIAVTYKGLPARTIPDYVDPLTDDSPISIQERQFHQGAITGARTTYIRKQLWQQFNDVLYSDTELKPLNHHRGEVMLFAPHSESFFDELTEIIENTVPLWEFVSIGYCWEHTQHPRCNALVYLNKDAMPPHPDTYYYTNENNELPSHHPDKFDSMTDEEFRERERDMQAHESFSDTPSTPRFTYGPAYIFNGDYDAGGCDILKYASEKLGIYPAFDTTRDEYPIRFPVGAQDIDKDIETVVTDYPDTIEVNDISALQRETTASKAPMELFSEEIFSG